MASDQANLDVPGCDGEDCGNGLSAPDLQVVIAYYQTARAEILERIRLREAVIVVWLGVMGAVVGVAFKVDEPSNEILLLLPVLALGFAMRIADHEKIIAKLAVYVSLDLHMELTPEGGHLLC